MISFARPLLTGNAVQVMLMPPGGATRWKLLRKTADTFVGHDDAGALVVADTQDARTFIDTLALSNGVIYYYRVYYWTDTAWSPSATVAITPQMTFTQVGEDAMLVVRQRIDDGLRAMVANGTVKHPKNHIQVLAALPAIDTITPPVVTVTLTSDTPQERGIGDFIGQSFFDEDLDKWGDVIGWYSRVSLGITAWTFNAEERIALRRALRSIIIANMDVFESKGLQMVEFSQQDSEDVESFNAAMYISQGTFSCAVIAAVTALDAADPIVDFVTPVTLEQPTGSLRLIPG